MIDPVFQEVIEQLQQTIARLREHQAELAKNEPAIPPHETTQALIVDAGSCLYCPAAEFSRARYWVCRDKGALVPLQTSDREEPIRRADCPADRLDPGGPFPVTWGGRA